VGQAVTTVPGWLPVVVQSFSSSAASPEGTSAITQFGVVEVAW
jgi:hypothetical protein